MSHPQAEHDAALRARLRQDFSGGPEPMDVPSTPLDTQIAGTHYNRFRIQPAEFIDKNGIPFLEGCVIKRMCRHEHKNGAEDLYKAIHEIQLILHLRYGV